MAWDSTAEREFWRRKCLDSFWWHFRYAYGYDFNPRGAAGKKPWMEEFTHKPLFDWLEKHTREWQADRESGAGRAKKLMVVVPRDFGKTTIGGALLTWLHLYDPELATYIGCETITRAREILANIKSVIGGEDRYSRFSWLYGSQKHPKRRWKLDAVVTSSRTNLTRRDASYGLWAVESGLVGMHPDACLFDDPNTYERMERQGDWLDIVNRHIDTLVPVFQSDALWIFMATRYGDGDHIGRTIKQEGVRSCSGMPMQGLKIEPDGLWDLFFLDAQDAEDKPTMPRIWPQWRIDNFVRRNPTRYWAQVRNNPTQTPYNVLPRSAAGRLVVESKDIDQKKLRVSYHFDTAFKTPRRRARGDYSVISRVGHEPKTGVCVFLGARGSIEWDSEQFAKELIDLIKQDRANGLRVMCMTDEQDIGGKPGVWQAFIQTVLRGGSIERPPELLLLDRDSRRKEERLAAAAALWRDGRMKLLKDAPGLEMLMEQMTKISMSDHDDYADATSDCFNKAVYSVVWPSVAAEPEKVRIGDNPFDDVLKPGPRGVIAAEKIAKMYADQEALGNQFSDVIAP